ncbi:MAG TPA: hypothetical protein VHV31_12200 [Nitrolancea sp.]|nr:hypothetical protein [Nitrolancea sp.]
MPQQPVRAEQEVIAVEVVAVAPTFFPAHSSWEQLNETISSDDPDAGAISA